MRKLAIVAVCGVAFVATGVLYGSLLWYGIIEPWLPTMSVRPLYYLVTWVALSWLGLRFLGLLRYESGDSDEESGQQRKPEP